VKRIVRNSNIPIIRISLATVRVRLSDIERFETNLISNQPTEYQSELVSVARVQLAKNREEAKAAKEAAKSLTPPFFSS
jgi:hypothetical protein